MLLCERPSGDGVALDFEDVANRATSYHAMQIRGKVSSNDYGTGSHGRALNTVVHGGARDFHRQGGREQGRGRRGNGSGTANVNNNSSNSNNSNGVFNSNGNLHGGSSAGNARGARGIGRDRQTSGHGGRGQGQDNGQNHQGRCRFCHNSIAHGWHNCPLRLSHKAEDQNANEQVNAVQESTSHVWCTQVQEDSNELEDFKIVVGDNTQVQNTPAAAQHEERAAGDVQMQKAPGEAMQGELAATHVQVQDAPGATQYVAFTNAFQVKEKVNSLSVGITTVYIDSAGSSHMMSDESFISKHLVEKADCSMRIKGSCSTSSATKKCTLKFGIRNAQDQVIPVALEVLLVRDLWASIFSVGALVEKGVKCNLLSTPPVLFRGTSVFTISTEVPRMHVVNIILDSVNLDGPYTQQEIFRTKVDAHMWHLRMSHCNPRALQQLADKETAGVKFNRNIEPGDCEVCSTSNSKKISHSPSDRPRA